MRRILNSAVIALALMLTATGLQAQKIAHINVDELIQLMPEAAKAREDLQKFRTQIQGELEEMDQERQDLITKFRQNEKQMTELRKESEMRKIQELAQRIEDYAMKAQEQLEEKQQELLMPIIEKAQNAINEVAKEKNFVYVLDSSRSKGTVVYAGGEDLMPLVKAKLNIN